MSSADPVKVHVILGSTRQGRFGDKPAHWIAGELRKKDGVVAELIDLRDWPLPFFDQPMSPARATSYADPLVQKWSAKIAAADAYVVVAGEYNHGYTAVLKNALDAIYREWNKKPISFVGYGNAGGARAIEQLRGVAVELKMAPIKEAVHLPVDVYLATMKEPVPPNPDLFSANAGVKAATAAMIDELVWWAKALRAARAA